MRKHETLVPLLAAMLLTLPIIGYGSGYVWARTTHHLVFYSGGFVARPSVSRGIGFSSWELAFAPLAWLEETLRRPLSR
jgi:hypothetical protein